MTVVLFQFRLDQTYNSMRYFVLANKPAGISKSLLPLKFLDDGENHIRKVKNFNTTALISHLKLPTSNGFNKSE